MQCLAKHCVMDVLDGDKASSFPGLIGCMRCQRRQPIRPGYENGDKAIKGLALTQCNSNPVLT